MTVPTTINKIIYVGDGTTVNFSFPFRIFEVGDLKVSLYKIATGEETLQTFTTHYSVTITGTFGGTVHMVTAPTSAYKLIIKRVLPLTQGVDYVEGDRFSAETHERALDKLTMIHQQIKEELDQAIKLDPAQTGIKTTLPPPQPKRFLKWNNVGDALINAEALTTFQYEGVIQHGLDADKPGNPSQGDMYFATDTKKYYFCFTAGNWHLINAISIGTEAQRPTAPQIGDVYFATDTGRAYYCLVAGTWKILNSARAGLLADRPPSPQVGEMYFATDADELYFCKVAGTWQEWGVLFVKMSGDQSIDGVKTFTSIPILPAVDPTTDNQASRKAYIDGKFPIVTAQIGPEQVTPEKLKHTFGEASRYAGAGTIANFALPGGDYGFWPSLRTNGRRVDVYVAGFLTSTTYVRRIGGHWVQTAILYAKCYYLTSSGQDHWLFLLIDKNTGSIISGYSAPDHPAYGNGGDFEKLPHPFGSYDSGLQEIVLVDKETILNLKKEKGATESLLTLINEDYKVDMDKTLKYHPLESGKVIDKKPVLVKNIPSYIKVRRLIKLSKAEKMKQKIELQKLCKKLEEEQKGEEEIREEMDRILREQAIESLKKRREI